MWELLEKLEKWHKQSCDARNHKKKKAEKFGRIAETFAVLWLRLKLYKILARRYRNRAGEIDIIAIRHKTIAFIEVKARKEQHLSDVLASSQQQRIMRAAEVFIATKPAYANHILRFDLVVIGTTHLPIHIADAWRRS